MRFLILRPTLDWVMECGRILHSSGILLDRFGGNLTVWFRNGSLEIPLKFRRQSDKITGKRLPSEPGFPKADVKSGPLVVGEPFSWQ